MNKGKSIYREVAKYAKDVKNSGDFALLQGFLRDLYALAVPRFCSVLSVLGKTL